MENVFKAIESKLPFDEWEKGTRVMHYSGKCGTVLGDMWRRNADTNDQMFEIEWDSINGANETYGIAYNNGTCKSI